MYIFLIINVKMKIELKCAKRFMQESFQRFFVIQFFYKMIEQFFVNQLMNPITYKIRPL